MAHHPEYQREKPQRPVVSVKTPTINIRYLAPISGKYSVDYGTTGLIMRYTGSWKNGWWDGEGELILTAEGAKMLGFDCGDGYVKYKGVFKKGNPLQGLADRLLLSADHLSPQDSLHFQNKDTLR